MQDNKIFKPKEDGGCYEILILKISPRTIVYIGPKVENRES